MPSLQQGAFDRADPVNCNNQGDVKRWLAKYIEGGAPPPAGTTFQLPDRRETDPPSSDKRFAHACEITRWRRLVLRSSRVLQLRDTATTSHV